MAKKVWETPDPTKKDKKLSPKKKAGVKTIKQGVKATKDWHKKND